MGRVAHGCLGHPLCPVPSTHSAHGPGGHSYPDKGVPGTHALCSLPTVLADVSRSLGEVVGPFVSHLVSGTQASPSGCRQHPHFQGEQQRWPCRLCLRMAPRFRSPCGPGRGWWPWSQSLPPTLLSSAPPKSAQWPPQNRTGPQGLGSRATAITRGIQLSHGAPQPLGSSGGSLVSQPRWGARDQSVPCDQRLRSSQGGRGGLVRGRPGALAFELYIHSLSVAVNLGPLLPQVCLKYYEHEFVELACQCPAVVCCRCSPTQKAHIVKLLQQHTGRRTCAIGEHPHAPGRVPHSPLAGLQRHGTRGPDPCLLSAREAGPAGPPHTPFPASGDGGNDVSMIQAADCGIGIEGKVRPALPAPSTCSGWLHHMGGRGQGGAHCPVGAAP